jgi:hypothetical protein
LSVFRNFHFDYIYIAAVQGFMETGAANPGCLPMGWLSDDMTIAQIHPLEYAQFSS